MSGVDGLTKENSETIGFVLASFFRSAIDLEELAQWCFEVIGQLPEGEAPAYLFDLADSNGSPAEIYRIIGYVPTWKHTARDEHALFGIALQRGKSRFEWPITTAKAMEALRLRPDIRERFLETFPFIFLRNDDASSE